jgi:hypothetical protein
MRRSQCGDAPQITCSDKERCTPTCGRSGGWTLRPQGLPRTAWSRPHYPRVYQDFGKSQHRPSPSSPGPPMAASAYRCFCYAFVSDPRLHKGEALGRRRGPSIAEPPDLLVRSRNGAGVTLARLMDGDARQSERSLTVCPTGRAPQCRSKGPRTLGRLAGAKSLACSRGTVRIPRSQDGVHRRCASVRRAPLNELENASWRSS